MTRAFRLVALLAVGVPVALHAASALTITKSSVVVADSVNALNPKALPGATVDYALLVDNPNGLLSGSPFRSVVISDVLSANTVLRTDDYDTAGMGPIEFADGNLLGLTGSGLALSYKGLADDTDGVEFSNGITWSYHPGAGFDPNVRAIRVTLTGTQAVLSTFRLRFRVKVK